MDEEGEAILAKHSRTFFVSGSSDCSLILWELPSGNKLTILSGHSSRVWSCAISRDGNTIVSGSSDKTVRIWDSTYGICLKILEGHSAEVYGCAISSDNKFIVSASSDATIKIWDTNSGFCQRTLSCPRVPPDELPCAYGCALSYDDKIIVSAHRDKAVRIWDASTGNLLKVLKHHLDSVLGITISNCGKQVISVSGDKTMCFSDIDSEICLQKMVHTSVVNGCAISKNNKFIVSACDDNCVHLWDVDGNHIMEYKAHASVVISCAFASNDKLIVSASYDNSVKIWDIDSGLCLKTLNDHSREVLCIVTIPNIQPFHPGHVATLFPSLDKPLQNSIIELLCITRKIFVPKELGTLIVQKFLLFKKEM